MSEGRPTRKLAAILATDMVGYSRLMGADEGGTITRQKSLRRELIDPKVAEHNGRIVKTTGDGLLVDFGSVVDAVECAVALQRAIAAREAIVPEERRIRYRTGIHLGDIVVDGADILGDGVNVAARLEALAQPGEICVSDLVRRSVEGKLDLAFEDLGERALKNIAKPVHVWRCRVAGGAGRAAAPMPSGEQVVRFCQTPDGVSLAYAMVGSGPPLVKAGMWYSHLELDWEGPVWRRLHRELSAEFRLLRYDQRGTGLSARDVADISLEAWVRDLETVVDAAGFDRFALFGISQGCPVSIAYAAMHPKRVTHLILHGGFAKGWLVAPKDDAAEQRHRAILTLMRQGWGRESPAFRQMFTSLFIPGGTEQEMAAFNEMERRSTSPENAARIFDTIPRLDVTGLIARITAPTLVTHSREDQAISHAAGYKMAARIKGARFETLRTRNHVPLEHEPVYAHWLATIKSFLRETPPPS
jgi:class 3 adenylate cyclase/pimeloyl-ACP methyl ester carboxylesterase